MPCQNKVHILVSVKNFKEMFPGAEPRSVLSANDFSEPMTVYQVQCGESDQHGRVAFCSKCWPSSDVEE